MGLHKKLEDITRDICLASDDEPDTSKVHKAFDKAAKKVYKKQKFTPDMLKDKDINNSNIRYFQGRTSRAPRGTA